MLSSLQQEIVDRLSISSLLRTVAPLWALDQASAAAVVQPSALVALDRSGVRHERSLTLLDAEWAVVVRDPRAPLDAAGEVVRLLNAWQPAAAASELRLSEIVLHDYDANSGAVAYKITFLCRHVMPAEAEID